jgi:hypothetical protein
MLRTCNFTLITEFLWWHTFRKYITVITPLSRVLHEELIAIQLIKEFSTFYGTRRFINMPPYFSKIHSNIFLPSTLRSLSGLFPSGFYTKILYAYLILLDLITVIIFGGKYKL